MNAQPNKFQGQVINMIMQVFVEFAANDITYPHFLEEPVLLNTLINGFVLKPKRVFPSVIFVELSSIYQNLAGVDNIGYLNQILDAGLPVAILHLLV